LKQIERRNFLRESNLIWRVDDRLIHGQVIIGWCEQLPIRLLVVCDDQIATTDWEKELLLMAAPAKLPTRILSTGETAEQIEDWIARDVIVMILIKSPAVLKKLVDLGCEIQTVNVGGIHFQENRKEFLPYLFLSNEDVEIFKQLMAKGIRFECQDLPNAPVYDLQKLIEKKQ